MEKFWCCCDYYNLTGHTHTREKCFGPPWLIPSGIGCMVNQNTLLSRRLLLLLTLKLLLDLILLPIKTLPQFRCLILYQISNTLSEAQCRQIVLQSKMQLLHVLHGYIYTPNQVLGNYFHTSSVMFSCPVQLDESLYTWILDFGANLQLVHNLISVNSE